MDLIRLSRLSESYQKIDPFREWRVAELQMRLAYAQARIAEQEIIIQQLEKIIEFLKKSGCTIPCR